LILFIFIKYSTEDQVYMEDEESRREFVLEDTGLIWRGRYICDLLTLI
jgi:hypothetical protein